MHKLNLLLLLILVPLAAQATTLVFDLRSGPGVILNKVDIEEAGAVYDGGTTGVTIETTPGQKTFRAIITAEVMAYDHEVEMRRRFYDHFQYLGSSQSGNQRYHVYRIRDVVRLPVEVVNGRTVDFRIHFDPQVPGLTYEQKNGQLQPIDAITKMMDNQHFGIVANPFTGSGSTSPRSDCVEQRPSPVNPIIVECVRWESR